MTSLPEPSWITSLRVGDGNLATRVMVRTHKGENAANDG